MKFKKINRYFAETTLFPDPNKKNFVNFFISEYMIVIRFEIFPYPLIIDVNEQEMSDFPESLLAFLKKIVKLKIKNEN